MSANRYPVKCSRCGEIVAPYEGDFRRTLASEQAQWPEFNRYRDSWFIEHPACHTKYDGTYVHYIHNPDLTRGSDGES